MLERAREGKVDNGMKEKTSLKMAALEIVLIESCLTVC